MSTGKYLYLATEPHACVFPHDPQPTVGSVWLCDCGQHYHCIEGAVFPKRWVPITIKKANEILSKVESS